MTKDEAFIRGFIKVIPFNPENKKKREALVNLFG